MRGPGQLQTATGIHSSYTHTCDSDVRPAAQQVHFMCSYIFNYLLIFLLVKCISSFLINFKQTNEYMCIQFSAYASVRKYLPLPVLYRRTVICLEYCSNVNSVLCTELEYYKFLWYMNVRKRGTAWKCLMKIQLRNIFKKICICLRAT